MSTTLIVIVAIVAALIGFLGFVATRPAAFRIQRSAVIKAKPETIFGFIDDFHRWTAWSPWEKKDPAMQRQFGGSASGKGATYAWQGNKDVGEGRMEIVESAPHGSLKIQLVFIKPFAANNMAEFTLTPAGDETEVHWAMYGPQPYVAKVMGLFLNMDKMIGKDFEAGLAALKASAES